MGLMSVSMADRFMRGRGVLDPSLSDVGKTPLQTHVSPEVNADGVGRYSWGRASRNCRIEGEVHLSFNSTSLLISCVMSSKFLNLSEPWFMHRKMV